MKTLYPRQQNPAGGRPDMKSEQRMAPMPAPCNRSALGAATMLSAAASHPCGVSACSPPPQGAQLFLRHPAAPRDFTPVLFTF